MQREGLDTRMSKIAIVTDSNSGITQAEGARRGIHVLPMPFMIDEVTYYEDIDLTQEQFYEKLKSGANIATSQPSPDSVTSLWDKLLQEYDEIVHIPMSSGLSGSCQSAMAFAADYDGRVQVVRYTRKIADMLFCTCNLIKKSGLAAVLITYKSISQLCAVG